MINRETSNTQNEKKIETNEKKEETTEYNESENGKTRQRRYYTRRSNTEIINNKSTWSPYKGKTKK